MAKASQKTNEIGIGHNSEVATPQQINDSLTMRFDELLSSTASLRDRARALPDTVSSDADLGEYATVASDIRKLEKAAESHREGEKAPYLTAGRAVDGFFKEKVLGELSKTADILGKRINDFQQAKLIAERAERVRQEKLRAEEERKAYEAAQEAERKAARARSENTKAAAQEAAEAAQEAAALAAKRAEEAAEATKVNAAGMTRQRFDSGSMVTMKTIKFAEVVDMDAIPLDKLRPYMKPEHIEAAVKAWAKFTSYGATMPGVNVGEREESVVI